MSSEQITTANSVYLELPIQAGIIQVQNISVTTDPSAYRELLACAQQYRQTHTDKSIGEIPRVQLARHLFRMMGIEPTKHRPSSEAMLRRVMKNKPIYSVNNLVDVSNWCALDFLLPNGIYDLRKIQGNIRLCKGRPGDQYIGVNRREVHLENRYALRDDIGPFGSPMTDSQRTMIAPHTEAAIAIIYAPPDYDPNRLFFQCQQYANRIVRHCGGHPIRVALGSPQNEDRRIQR